MASIAVGMRQAGVTTLACLCDIFAPIYLTRALDAQQFFPEHLVALQWAGDADPLGRLYSPTQWRNAFGPGAMSAATPKDQMDMTKAWRDAGNAGEPRFVTQVVMHFMKVLAAMLQWAGPNLNPFTLERGAFEGPQVGGWENPNAWPGWKCCVATAEMIKFGPGDYAAYSDARHVYYDPNARSAFDGRPGAYVCLAGCRRYPIGSWSPGEPRE